MRRTASLIGATISPGLPTYIRYFAPTACEYLLILGQPRQRITRVVEDIRQQLGDIVIQRGTLARESLALDALVLGEQSSRLAWLATVIPQFSKSGIVYTPTTRDAELVAEWLRKKWYQCICLLQRRDL